MERRVIIITKRFLRADKPTLKLRRHFGVLLEMELDISPDEATEIIDTLIQTGYLVERELTSQTFQTFRGPGDHTRQKAHTVHEQALLPGSRLRTESGPLKMAVPRKPVA